MIKKLAFYLCDYIMKVLELFSGTKSVGKVAEQLGYEVTSLDLKNADINTDILRISTCMNLNILM